MHPEEAQVTGRERTRSESEKKESEKESERLCLVLSGEGRAFVGFYRAGKLLICPGRGREEGGRKNAGTRGRGDGRSPS